MTLWQYEYIGISITFHQLVLGIFMKSKYLRSLHFFHLEWGILIALSFDEKSMFLGISWFLLLINIHPPKSVEHNTCDLNNLCLYFCFFLKRNFIL